MPRGRPPRIRVFADKMTRPQTDIRADQRLDCVQHLITQQEAEQPLIPEMRRVQFIGQLVALLRQLLLEYAGELGQVLRPEERFFVNKVPIVPVMLHLGCRPYCCAHSLIPFGLCDLHHSNTVSHQARERFWFAREKYAYLQVSPPAPGGTTKRYPAGSLASRQPGTSSIVANRLYGASPSIK